MQAPSNYTDISLGDSSIMRKYTSLNLHDELKQNTPIVAVQKSTLEIVDGILQKIGIADAQSISITDAMGRSGFTKVVSQEYGSIGFVGTKGGDSTLSFSGISDYYLGGTDIGQKVMSRGAKLEELSKIPGDQLWEYKTELLCILGMNSIYSLAQSGQSLDDFSIDMLATKYTPTITKNAIRSLPDYYTKPVIDTVDSNSELVVQVLEYLYPNNIVGGVEIVQSGSSLVATNNAIIRNGKLIMPSKRDKQTGDFLGEVIAEIDPLSQVGRIASAVQTNIDVSLYKVSNSLRQKPQNKFIQAFIEEM